MKGIIKPDHIPVNNFDLLVAGLIDLTAVEVSGIEDTLQTIDLPDRTRASGGNREATSFTVMIPAHHTAEFLAMEAWFKEGQDPILPTYKKPCTLVMKSLSGNIQRSFSLIGVFVQKRTLPDLDKSEDGEMASIEYEMSVDDIFPL